MPRSIKEIYKDVEWATDEEIILHDKLIELELAHPWVQELYDDPCHCGSMWCRVHISPDDPGVQRVILKYARVRKEIKRLENASISKDTDSVAQRCPDL
jgi:hypothetical protein